MPKRILVVDDEPDTLGLIELTLSTAGYEVRTGFDGKTAIALLRQEPFDLLLLDVMMPDLSGFEVIRQLQAGSTALPPLIFLTAKNRAEDRDQGNALGAVAYLVKPTTRGQLLDAIRRVLGESA
jgi:two-component system sensor histidine kinase ChiS